MFLPRRAKSPRPAVPLPDSGADGWAILESTGREVFAVMCRDPHDMDHPAHPDRPDHVDYKELFEEFRTDPQYVLRPALKPPVASGITVSAALLYILPVTAWLLRVAAERVAGQAVDALGSATREKLRALLSRRRDGTSGNEPDTGAEPVALDANEEQAALTALVAYAASIGADAAESRAVAEAVITLLRNRGGGASAGQ
ncbi:hypothetical protein [Streptomyces sp. NPDC127084]|uniref:hypothetical protein n=1 Tax=Streptomyces sp. NPDC127084 TaxID=3347133 RepID=UPI003652603B